MTPLILVRIPDNIVNRIASALAETWLSKEELMQYFGEKHVIQFLTQFEDFLLVGGDETSPIDYYALGENEIEAEINKVELLSYSRNLWDSGLS